MQAYRSRWRRNGTRLMLGCILAASVSACAAIPLPSHSVYKPVIPSLTIEQFESCVVMEAESQRERQTMCVRLLAQEYGEIVTEYKAMCLALGHGAEYCGTSGVRMEPSLMPMVPVGTQAGGCFPVELRGQ